jgi:hypothetical protein
MPGQEMSLLNTIKCWKSSASEELSSRWVFSHSRKIFVFLLGFWLRLFSYCGSKCRSSYIHQSSNVEATPPPLQTLLFFNCKGWSKRLYLSSRRFPLPTSLFPLLKLSTRLSARSTSARYSFPPEHRTNLESHNHRIGDWKEEFIFTTK